MKETLTMPIPEILDRNERASRFQSESLSEAEIIRRIRILAELLDNRFVIPGTQYRIGLDAIIGLIPGIGDVASTAISAYIVYLAHQLNVPKTLLARMMFNVAVDFSVGVVPVVGDLLDVAWKANLKNVRLLERHLLERSK